MESLRCHNVKNKQKKMSHTVTRSKDFESIRNNLPVLFKAANVGKCFHKQWKTGGAFCVCENITQGCRIHLAHPFGLIFIILLM